MCSRSLHVNFLVAAFVLMGDMMADGICINDVTHSVVIEETRIETGLMRRFWPDEFLYGGILDDGPFGCRKEKGSY